MAGHLRYSYPQTEAPRRAHGGGYEPAVRLWGLLRAPVALLLSLIGRRERNPNGFLHTGFGVEKLKLTRPSIGVVAHAR